MNFVHFVLLLGATQVSVHSLDLFDIELSNIYDDSFPKLLPSLVNTFGLNPESRMSTIQLVLHRGYPIEVHTVTTSDNYILTMHRIPRGKNRNADPSLDPILLIHGTFGFADHFLINTPENSFAYLLADAGFDVWLANLRGTEHSHLHKYLFSSNPKYWEFSWDEMAMYDLPAFVDGILKVTKHSKVYLSGHSLGGGLPIAFLSAKPNYMSKVRGIFGLAPMGNLENLETVGKLPQVVPLVKIVADLLGMHELYKLSPLLMGYLGKNFELILRTLMFSLQGPNPSQWDSERSEMNHAHLFSTMGLNVVYHLDQMINDNGLRKFDWGKEINMKKYGRETPPDYELSHITVPVYLFYGENDWFCSKENVQFLQDRLPNSKMEKAGNGFNHIDFLWGKTAGSSFYNPLVSLIKTV